LALLAGSRLGAYDIITSIGEGGMGSYRARTRSVLNWFEELKSRV
jgi:hypothetical protein